MLTGIQRNNIQPTLFTFDQTYVDDENVRICPKCAIKIYNGETAVIEPKYINNIFDAKFWHSVCWYDATQWKFLETLGWISSE